MAHRIALFVPVVSLLAVLCLLFLAARAPRTWADHWMQASDIGSAGGQMEFGAVARAPGRWDRLWVDPAAREVRFAPAGHQYVIVDRGEVLMPTLIRTPAGSMGFWIHNYNGYSALRGAVFTASGPPRTATLIKGPAPLEHPYAFPGPGGRVRLVLSWQHPSNFDVYYLEFLPTRLHPVRFQRLTHSPDYAFFPRAAPLLNGSFALVHLESCCRQQSWNVDYQRFNDRGQATSAAHTIIRVDRPRIGSDQPEWGLDVQRDGRGRIWTAVTGLGGMWLQRADRAGRLRGAPQVVDPLEGDPNSAALAVGVNGGYVFWQQQQPLGSFIAARPFDARGGLGAIERVEYLSGYESYPHAAVTQRQPSLIWQSERADNTSFETAAYRRHVVPTLAQRLGLGLADPWSGAAVLAVGALGIGTLVTVVNLLLVLLLGGAGMVLVRVCRRLRARWLLYTALLALALYAMFVEPGAPAFFLGPMPALGLQARPFGLLAAGGSLLFVLWISQIALRRIDDVYRACLMAFFGVFFFAFLESAVYVQQHLGTI